MAVTGTLLASININGLHPSINQIPIFFKQYNLDILCLQETHSFHSKNITSQLDRHKLHIFCNSVASNKHKSGTAIIVNANSFQSKNLQHTIIDKNRSHAITFSHHNKTFTIINTYLPSGSSADKINLRTSCIHKLSQYLQSSSTHHTILAGDFNMVLHPQDKANTLILRKDVHTMKALLQQSGLLDSFRIKHPNKIHFTYTRSNAASRLDRIYISQSLRNNMSHSSHIPVPFSDHLSAPRINLQLPTQNSHAHTYWKLNNSLLSQQHVKDNFKTSIALWQQKHTFEQDILTWWEKLKIKTRHFFQLEGKLQNRRTQTTLNTLHEQLNNLNPHTDQEQINIIHQKLQDLAKIKTKGAHVRARIKNWPENEEIPPGVMQTETNQQARQVLSLQNTLLPPRQLVHQHYSQLWATTPAQHDYKTYLASIKTVSPPEEQEPHSPFITTEEISTAIQAVRNGTAPGNDGLTPEFYKCFSSQLTPILQQVYNNIFLQRQLTDTQKQSLVKLLPKKPRPTVISHWRPISLLNIDYKILSKIITSRTAPLLSPYISQTQQCALPTRKMEYIHHNILAAKQWAEDTNTKISILQLDYTKAFDNLSHSFIAAILNHIRLPAHLIQWIEILLRDVSSRIQVNQELTPPISMKKGIRQGCPLSMLLFVLATDILSQKISHSHLLRGVTLSQNSLKILQYADDTTILLTESDSIPALKKILTQFSTHANLEINLKKSKLMSTSHYLSEQITRRFPDIVATNEITILGIPFSLHHDSGNALWEKTIQKIRAIAQQNSHENMSLYGKTTLVNALLMPHILMAARLFFPFPLSNQKTQYDCLQVSMVSLFLGTN